MKAIPSEPEAVKVHGTFERVLVGSRSASRRGWERFRPLRRACGRPWVVRRKLLIGRSSTRWGRPTSADDPLWSIIGIGDPGPDAPTDVSQNIDKYLADAYAADLGE
jgi:hypothetical protein